MRRREFLLGVASGSALAASGAAGQEAGKVPRVGFLGNSTAALEGNLLAAFRDGLREFGYVEGRNITIEYRWADGSYERFPSLIADLVALKVDVIVTAGTPAALAVTNATKAIPLVMVAVGDPIGTGLAASLARPGRNATGLTSITPDLEGKRLELIKEMLPNASRLAVFWNPANAYQMRDEREAEGAAAALRIATISVPAQTAEDLDNAFAAVLKERAEAVLVLADRLFLHNRARIVDFTRDKRVPVMSAYRELAEAGGLMSFGPNYAIMHKQAARYVDKILKGAKPEDLPIEQPERFEFVVNLKSAKNLGIEVPPTLLARADEVIE